jgi:hypothetical protein
VPRMSRKKAELLSDLNVCFDHEPGQRVLQWMRTVLGEGETLTPEEMFNEQLDRRDDGRGDGRYRRIDPVALHLREGMRRAYRKVALMYEEAQKLKEKP